MKKFSLLFFILIICVGQTFAQRMVSGNITDVDNTPLIGANVIAKGTSIGTITDIDGNFSLEVPTETTMLEISYTGFETQNIDIAGRNEIVVALSEGTVLEEVVVTAVGLEANRAKLGYAVQNVDPDELLGSRETNLVNALNGKVAGVQVTSSSGSPGSSANIRIRGSVSITGNNSPLFVVDGMPIDNDTYGNAVDGLDNSNRAIDINPNDIASMTVLKGPSATALYGVRAANGAIVITTKKGSSGKPTVTVSGSYSLDRVNKLPEMQSTYAQGRYANGVATYLGPSTGNGFSWGPRIADLEYDGVPTVFSELGTLQPRVEGSGLTPAQAYDQFDFFVDGGTYDLNASVAGGTDAMNYFISAGTLESNGIVPNSSFTRNSFRANINSDITDRLTAGVTANFVNSGGDRIQRGSNLNGVMLGLLRTAPTFDNGRGLTGVNAVNNPESYINPDGTMRSYRNGIYDNPYWTVNRNPASDDVNRIIGTGMLRYKLTDWLSVNYRAGVDTYTDKRTQSFDLQTNSFRQVPGTIIQDNITNKDVNTDLFLTASSSLTDNIGISAVVGYNTFSHLYNRRNVTGNTLSIPNFFAISNATDITTEEVVDRYKINGLYGTADLSFNDFLFLNLTARNDWSSTLPKENNSYQSYSASLGFAFTEALNLRSDLLSYGKLRLSYGVVGNDASTFLTTSVFDPALATGDGFITDVEFPAYGVNAFERSTRLGNNLITPESTSTFEIGGEFKLFRGRVGLDVTYYDATSEDLIIPVEIAPSTGYFEFVQNAAVVTNTGVEAVLNVTPVRNDNFSWDIGINFNTYENNVESLAPGIENIGLAGFVSTSADVVAGLPYSSIFGTGFQRTENGDVIIGADGWPLADPTKKALGDPNPDWTAGIRNTFNLGGLSVSALVDVRQGGDVWCGTCGIINYFGTSEQSAVERDDVVTFDGVVQTGTDDEGNPIYSENTTAVALAEADLNGSFASSYRVRYGFGGISEMNIHDSSWIRLRELSIGYNVPAETLKGLPFKGANIGFTGRNLLLSTDYPGIDPETNLTGSSNGIGLDYFNMPNTKSYSATVKLTF